jgi:hypothetical protein
MIPRMSSMQAGYFERQEAEGDRNFFLTRLLMEPKKLKLRPDASVKNRQVKYSFNLVSEEGRDRHQRGWRSLSVYELTNGMRGLFTECS